MSATPDQGATGWHKSSYSGQDAGSTCVEQGLLPDGRVAVRDTKQHGTGTVLAFTTDEWKALLATV